MKPCPHCGLPPTDNQSIYCAEGWQECLRRQAEIDADPMVTNLVYGNFEDPATGRNAIVIQFQRGRKYKELAQISRAVRRVLDPWFGKEPKKNRRFNFDGEPFPHFGDPRLWSTRTMTRYRWIGGKLVKMLPLIQEN